MQGFIVESNDGEPVKIPIQNIVIHFTLSTQPLTEAIEKARKAFESFAVQISASELERINEAMRAILERLEKQRAIIQEDPEFLAYQRSLWIQPREVKPARQWTHPQAGEYLRLKKQVPNLGKP